MVEQKYRWDFIGLSTDSKPTASSPRVVNGSTYYEADTSKAYVWYNDQWYEKIVTGGGGGSSVNVVQTTGDSVTDVMSQKATTDGINAAKGTARELTEADYNYPTDNPTSVALWLLEPGLYTKSQDATVKISTIYSLGKTEVALVGKKGSYGIPVIVYTPKVTTDAGVSYGRFYLVAKSNGVGSLWNEGLGAPVVNDLTSSDKIIAPLSAAQGAVLNDKIETRIIAGGTTAPTTSTVGSVGALYAYVDNGTGHLAICTAADTVTPAYTWQTLV